MENIEIIKYKLYPYTRYVHEPLFVDSEYSIYFNYEIDSQGIIPFHDDIIKGDKLSKITLAKWAAQTPWRSLDCRVKSVGRKTEPPTKLRKRIIRSQKFSPWAGPNCCWTVKEWPISLLFFLKVFTQSGTITTQISVHSINHDRRIYAAAWMHVHLLFPFTQLFSIEPFYSFITPETQPCPLFPLYALIPLR